MEEWEGAWRRCLPSFLFCNNSFIDIYHTIHPFKVSFAKLCLTLCDPMNYSLPGSSVHGISQARRV